MSGKKSQPKHASDALISHFNTVSEWVATEIIALTDLKDRLAMLVKFINMAQYCFENKNFNTALEVVSALNMSPVARLKKNVGGIKKEE